MYNLYFWNFAPQLLCTFSDYEAAKKAEETLKKRYPTSEVWLSKPNTISCFQEFLDKFDGGKIQDYESYLPKNKIVESNG